MSLNSFLALEHHIYSSASLHSLCFSFLFSRHGALIFFYWIHKSISRATPSESARTHEASFKSRCVRIILSSHKHSINQLLNPWEDKRKDKRARTIINSQVIIIYWWWWKTHWMNHFFWRSVWYVKYKKQGWFNNHVSRLIFWAEKKLVPFGAESGSIFASARRDEMRLVWIINFLRSSSHAAPPCSLNFKSLSLHSR